MTEQETTTMMTREEFEEHHVATGNYIARVGKIWEDVAGEQQAIVDGKGYRHLGYSSWVWYWDGEFAAESGWTPEAVRNWLKAKRVKDSTPLGADAQWEPSGPEQWRDLSQIKDPQERAEFIERYDEFRPAAGTQRAFREAVKDFKGEPTVKEALSPEDMADIPSGEFDRFENWASESSKIVASLRRMQPEEVADACERLYADKLARHVDWADQIASWYAKYRDDLVARSRQGIRAV